MIFKVVSVVSDEVVRLQLSHISTIITEKVPNVGKKWNNVKQSWEDSVDKNACEGVFEKSF